jgi:hypothetical protein
MTDLQERDKVRIVNTDSQYPKDYPAPGSEGQVSTIDGYASELSDGSCCWTELIYVSIGDEEYFFADDKYLEKI